MKTIRWAILLALAPAPMFAQKPANAWLVVPGSRVGPVTAGTTRSDLNAFFPKNAIENDEMELDEGMVQPATFVNRRTPSEALAIVWAGKGPQSPPLEIFLCRGHRGGACRWQVEGGIGVGTRLLDLEERNGKPFTIFGFGWDYGGNVLSWNGGKLERLDCGGRVVLTLDGERNGRGELTTLTAEEARSISGYKSISSADAVMRKLDPRVVDLLYQFPPRGGKPCK